MAQDPITPNRQGTMEPCDEVLSSVCAQDMEASGYQVSDLEEIKFKSENPDLNMDAVFQPGIDTPFLSIFNDFEMGSLSENPILLDKEQSKENFSPLPTLPVSERPTHPQY